MFLGFSSPNFTPVPDELFDELLADLSGAETKILLYIIRRTFGFKKYSDDISLSQLVDGITTKDGEQLDRGTGLSKSTVAVGLKSLVSQGVLISHRNRTKEKGDVATTYTLHFREDPVSDNRTGGSPKIGQARVRNSDTQYTVLQDICSDQVGADVEPIWAQTLEALQGQMTATNYQTWLVDTKLIQLNGTKAIIGSPTIHQMDWLSTRLYPMVNKIISDVVGRKISCQFVVHNE